MQIAKEVADRMGSEWVQLLLPGFEGREAGGDVVVVSHDVVRVYKRTKKVYNHKTAEPGRGVDTTP